MSVIEVGILDDVADVELKWEVAPRITIYLGLYLRSEEAEGMCHGPSLVRSMCLIHVADNWTIVWKSEV